MSSLQTYNYKNITTATTTVVAKGPGILHTLAINGTVASAITLYDNTVAAAPIIATISQPLVNATTLTYDVRFTTGLTVVTAGASDITVSIG